MTKGQVINHIINVKEFTYDKICIRIKHPATTQHQVMINTYSPRIMNLINRTFYNSKLTNTKQNKNTTNKNMKKRFVTKPINQK
jgi:hypothetical protein